MKLKSSSQILLEQAYEAVNENSSSKKFIQDEPVTAPEAEENGELPNPESVQDVEDVIPPTADVLPSSSSKKRISKDQMHFLSRIAHQLSKRGMHSLGLKLLQNANRIYKFC